MFSNVFTVTKRGFVFYFSLLKRYLGLDNRYVKLNNFKNVYHGKRCFIVAPGTTLDPNLVSKLKNEVLFGVNSSAFLFETIDWSPDYFVFQDQKALDEVVSLFHSRPNVQLFLADGLDCRGLNNEIIYFPHAHCFHGMNVDFFDKRMSFSSNAFLRVNDGFTVVFSVIQLAHYLGFQEVLLIGVDGFYPKHRSHFFRRTNNLHYHRWAEKQSLAYKCVADYSAKATRFSVKTVGNKSRVECFEVVMPDVLNIKVS